MTSDANRRAKKASAVLLLATSLRKFNSRIQAFKRAMDLTCIGNEEGLKGLSNLILANGYRFLEINLFQVVLKTRKV